MENWNDIFNYFYNKKTKLRNVDTCFYTTLKRFKKNVDDNIKDFFIDHKYAIIHIEMKGEKERCQILIDNINVTPMNHGTDVSYYAIRQYVEMFMLVGLIKPINLKTLKRELDANKIFTLTIYNKTSIIDIDKNLSNHILINGINNPFQNIEEIFFTLIIYLFCDHSKKEVINLFKNIKFTRKTARKKDKTFSISCDEDIKKFINEYKTTYQKTSKVLKKYFLLFKNNKLLELLIESLTGSSNEIIFDSNLPHRIEVRKIEDLINKARLKASKIKREISNKNNIYVDLKNYEQLPNNVMDVAHVKSCKKIKHEIWMEFAKYKKNNEEIQKIIDEIMDINNLLLLPHNIHYLLDKKYLILNKDGIIKTIETAEQNNSEINISKLYKKFGIEEKYYFINDSIITEKFKKFVDEM